MSENVFDRQGSHSYPADRINAKAATDETPRRIQATSGGAMPNQLFLATLTPAAGKGGSPIPDAAKVVRLVVAPGLGDVEAALKRGFFGPPHFVESVRKLPDTATLRLSAKAVMYLPAGTVLDCEVEEA